MSRKKATCSIKGGNTIEIFEVTRSCRDRLFFDRIIH